VKRAAAVALLVGCGGSSSYRALELPSTCREQVERSEGERCAVWLHDELMTGVLGVYDDPALEAYVTEVGLRIVAVADRDDVDWTFRVLDEPRVQAWAGPGGFVYLTRGLLVHLDSEAELAAVIGHEVGHVAAGHTDVMLDRLPDPTFGGVDFSSQFSLARDDEAQADQLAVRYAAAAGYDPRAVQSMLIAIHQEGLLEPGSWSDRHPPLGVRLSLTARATDGRSSGRREETRYLSHIEGVVVGSDPRQGRVHGDRFVHERGGFSFALPGAFAARSVGTNGFFTALGPEEREGLSFFPLAHPRGAVFELALETDMAHSPTRPVELAGFEGLEGTIEAGETEEVRVSNVSGTVPVVSFEAGDGHSYGFLVFSNDDPARARVFYRDIVRSFRREPAATPPRRVRLRRVGARTTLAREIERGCGEHGEAEALSRLNEIAIDAAIEAGRTIKCVGS
jgi:predicted Zn-dependent protease